LIALPTRQISTFDVNVSKRTNSAAGDQAASVSAVESVVTLTFTSWNRIAGWLRRLEGLRIAA
jgi:hypothetical protein